jgi:hypothetical protein
MLGDSRSVGTLAVVPPEESAETRGLVEGIEASFAEAASSQIDWSDLRLAGFHVRLRSPNRTMLERLNRAFAHLATEARDGEPDLTIDLWDSTTGARTPPMPDVGAEQAPGAFFHLYSGSVRLAYQLGTSGDGEERVLTAEADAPTPALSAYDASRGVAWYWVDDVDRIPYWDESTPVRYILDWWLRDRGIHLIHAGAVGTSRGGALLVGKGGSGKSTSTLASLESELQYAGDDYVGVGLEPTPWVHSLYSSGKLVPDHAQRLPFLRPVLPSIDPDEPVRIGALGPVKAIVYTNEYWPERLSSGFPLRAVLVPRVTPGRDEARILPLSPAAGLAALAPSTVLQMHVDGQDSLARMRRLLQSVPCYLLEAGADIPSIPQAIFELLASLDEGGEQ